MNNPLTKNFKSKFGLPPFEEIKPKHYLPCLLYTSDAADDQ